MRIAQLANFIGPSSGGMKTAVAALGSGYVAAGAERLLVVPGPVDKRLETEDGIVVQLRAPRVGGGYRLIVEPWRVIDALEEFNPTSVEINDKATLLPVARWARRNNVAAVLFSHERLDDMVAMRTGLDTGAKVSIGLWNRLLVRQFDAIVVTSRYARREFATAAAASGTPIVQVPLGVDLETFRPAPVSRGTELSAAGSPGMSQRGIEPLRLVHVGRLSREKSPHLAVATAVELHRRGVPVILDVYGQGPHRHELEEIAGDAPVRFHGHVSGRAELARRIAAADIALSVCPGETFGLAVLESLACGTPVVTARTGGASELIDAGSGAWGDPDPASLADAVLRLASRDVASRRTAARARAEEFPWSATIAAMVELHADLAQSGGSSPLGVLAGWLASPTGA
jgi:alpha-1,6-mannosyltransferase